MAMLEDLEAALRVSYDRDTIAVYGDLLQAAGELRGELIAIDLALDAEGPDAAVLERRAQLVEQWLGGKLPNGRVRYGFLELDATSADPVGQVQFAFAGPAAAYVRSVAIVGPPALVRAAVAIASRPRCPHLVRLAIRTWDEEADRPTLSEGTARALAEAFPHLTRLELEGRRILAAFHHPAVRRMTYGGWDAIVSDPWALPALAELDLALYCHLGSHDQPPPPTLLARVPPLRHLDLSRNEPGFHDPVTLGGETRVVDLLRAGKLDRLETLRLPSLDDAGFATLRAVLPRMPALRRLDIARGPGKTPALAHPSAEIRFFDR